MNYLIKAINKFGTGLETGINSGYETSRKRNDHQGNTNNSVTNGNATITENSSAFLHEYLSWNTDEIIGVGIITLVDNIAIIYAIYRYMGS